MCAHVTIMKRSRKRPRKVPSAGKETSRFSINFPMRSRRRSFVRRTTRITLRLVRSGPSPPSGVRYDIVSAGNEETKSTENQPLR